ncbi:MAG: redoxin domain-containing protein [Verrucomicrobiales bacterium]|nr:redoxin domain-containing protein [Verrucomicrobiales bacterium]
MKHLPLLLTLLVVSSIAHSQDRLKELVFHRHDLNGDGTVTPSELPDAATRAKFDGNGDGDVTLAEYRKTVGITTPEKPAESSDENSAALVRLNDYVKETDRNGDGQLSKEETGGAEWFTRVDRNKDGVIGVAEIDAVRALVKKFGDRILPTVPEIPVTREEVAEITSGPEILKPGQVGIGRRISDVEFTDIEGKAHRISEVKKYKGLVIAMTSATCPVSKRLLPSLAAIEPRLMQEGIPLVLVNAFGSEKEEQIREQLKEHSFSAPYVHDTAKTLSRALNAATTTEVFLIDSRQTLVYRGALDDQYGIDYSIDEARHHYLADAVAAFLKGERPVIAATAAPGCELNLGRDTETTNVSGITYHRDISRILQQNCVQCHHDGGIAPFALDEFEEVSDRARVIKRVVSEGTMPPWFAASPEEGEDTRWANDHSLSARDKADLLAWLDSDQELGDPAEAPAPVSFPTEWSMGEPDAIIPLSKAYKIKATGFMPYQKDIVVTELGEDKWVTGYEILPSERDVVHHVIVQVFEKGATVRDRGKAGGYWAAYVPGNGAVKYPEGFAKKLPAGAKVHFQIHYTPSGKEKMERLRMGLHFSDEAPRYEVKTLAVADRKLEIPPGAKAHEEGTSRVVPFDIPAMSFMAHMHVRGSAFSYEVTYPDGKNEMLLDIPRYDFNWQLRYELKTPKILPKGSTVKVTGVFDNSEQNKANPDPAKTIKWGDQTVDEMLIGYIEYFVPIPETTIAGAE